MRLTEIRARHYKSFNCDYLSKADTRLKEQAWETIGDAWFPFVKVPLERDVTAIVGANESGKSHLLDAIEILCGARKAHRRDFCRYSPLFSVERGTRLVPDFAGLFEASGEEKQVLAANGVPQLTSGAFLLRRHSGDAWQAIDDEGNPFVLSDEQIGVLVPLLPATFRLKTDVPLPDSIPIRALTKRDPLQHRAERNRVLDLVGDLPEVAQTAAVQTFLSELSVLTNKLSANAIEQEQENLGVLLLQKIARVEESVFEELDDAIRTSHEGHANGLVQQINASIERHLQLTRWWRQDPDFSLRVSLREHELVFVIRDRTATDYSFDERSTGLRYFLSYLIQLQGHPALTDEILLMDEPDTYLSASGQQDLMRVLENHVTPDGRETDSQVVYVTHSPFLINRNAARRIRVLDKGRDDEGTRVVKDATQNRYEPLRSSIGSFVAETAFIGGANLFVEGASDQIYLAEMATQLRSRGRAESGVLDLNEVTIVPCGSASSIPYMLYLARGQDEVKPPCAVLLDSDDSGRDARDQIRKGGAYRKRLVPDDFVIMMGDWADSAHPEIAPGVTLRETEDLLPLKVATAAARRYAVVFLGAPEASVAKLTDEVVAEHIVAADGSLFDGLAAAFKEHIGASLEKIGLAKQVVLVSRGKTGRGRPDGVPALEANFSKLLEHLAEKVRGAVTQEANRRRDGRIDRTVSSFVRDYPLGATRDRANLALRDIWNAADESDRFEEIHAAIEGLRRDFELAKEPLRPIADYERFRERFEGLRRVERIHNEGAVRGAD